MADIVPAHGPGGSMPDVTVLLATSGRLSTIGRSLESLAGQSLDPARFEVVVIVNGSADGTGAYVTDFARTHPRLNVRVLETEVRGVAHARNLGLRAARGAYMTILDDDDWLSPGYLAGLLGGIAPGVVPLAWLADIVEGAEEPVYDNYYSNAIAPFTGTVLDATGLGQAISLNVCKLVPVAAAREVGYDESLEGGSDFVFWTKLYAHTQFRFHVLPDRTATYFRTQGHGSLSRRTHSFDFNVRMRLDCIESLSDIAKPAGPDVERIVHHVVSAQCLLINEYLAGHPESRQAVIDAVERRRLTRFSWRTVNRTLADELLISYCFPPWDGARGTAVARRVREREVVVDVISKRVAGAQESDPAARALAAPYVGRHDRLPGPTSATRPTAVRAFVSGVLETVATRPGEYGSVYSLGSWPASHLAAALVKLRNPEVRWVAELSEPLARTSLNEPRTSPMADDALTDELRAGIRAAGLEPPTEQWLHAWAEQAVYAIADEVVFGDDALRSFMLSYADDATGQRVREVSGVVA